MSVVLKAQELPDGSLVIQESWPIVRSACVVGGCLLPAIMLFAELARDSIDYGRIIGALLGSVLLCSIAAIVSDRRLAFDAARKMLAWEERSWLRARGGQLPFSDIKDVVVTQRRSRDDDSIGGYTEYGAVLVTAAGQIPLTSTFGRNKREYEQLAASVLALLSGPGGHFESEDEVSRLVAAGRMIDAVTLIRAQKGLGLTEAMDLAAKIKRGLQP